MPKSEIEQAKLNKLLIMKTLKYVSLFLLILSVNFCYSQQQTITLPQHKLEVTKVSMDGSYNGFAPYNPNKNADFDKVLIVELGIISGDSNIKFDKGDFEIWLTDDLNNKISGADKTVLTSDKTFIYLFNINSKAKSFKMHFGKSKVVSLTLSK